MVAATSGTMTPSVATASSEFRKNKAIPTPTKVQMLTTAEMRPVSTSVSNESTSVVIRVMIRPAISRS